MDLVNSKNKIIDEINTIIESYQSIETSHSNEMKLFTGEVERLNQFNNKLKNCPDGHKTINLR